MSDEKISATPSLAEALATNAKTADGAELAEWVPPKEWSRQWQDLALDLVDPDRKLTPLEVAYFFTRAKALSLDPLARQIFPVKLNGRMEPFVGIHGIRMLAERTGERTGEKVTARQYGEGGALSAIEVTVTRNGNPYVFLAHMAEFAQKEPAAGTPQHFAWEHSAWHTKPEVMLTKCAAANCYRMAFPEVLGGLYIPEEVERE
jgi:phage recombination protein Bet